MTVEPTNRGPLQPSKTSKPRDAALGKKPDAKPKEVSKVPNTVVDKVEVSSAAQELHELTGSERHTIVFLGPVHLCLWVMEAETTVIENRQEEFEPADVFADVPCNRECNGLAHVALQFGKC